jgi:hypothetical protein
MTKVDIMSKLKSKVAAALKTALVVGSGLILVSVEAQAQGAPQNLSDAIAKVLTQRDVQAQAQLAPKAIPLKIHSQTLQRFQVLNYNLSHNLIKTNMGTLFTADKKPAIRDDSKVTEFALDETQQSKRLVE